MKLRLMRNSWTIAVRSAAISSHAQKPRDRLWLSRWLKLLRIDSRFAVSIFQYLCHIRRPLSLISAAPAPATDRCCNMILTQEFKALRIARPAG